MPQLLLLAPYLGLSMMRSQLSLNARLTWHRAPLFSW